MFPAWRDRAGGPIEDARFTSTDRRKPRHANRVPGHNPRSGRELESRNVSCYTPAPLRRNGPARPQDETMAAGHRIIITLECTTCRERNYSTTKNKRANAEKLELSKFCWRCRKHQNHKETK